MYQVDFVAALFGAFLLLWISKAGSGLSYDDPPGIVVVQGWCPKDDAVLLPIEDALRCASSEIVAAANPSLQLMSCESLPVDATAIHGTVDGEIQDVPLLDSLQAANSAHAFSSVVSSLEFFDSNQMTMPGFSIGGFALARSLTPTDRLAVGYGPGNPPAFVSIARPQYGLLVAECRRVSGSNCKRGTFAVFRAPYSGKHNQFTVRIWSDAWPEPCLENVNVVPDGTPHPLQACSS